MHRIVLFDLDGTLVDTAPDLAAAANARRRARGLADLPESQLRPFATRGAAGILGRALGLEATNPAFPAEREAFLEYYAAHCAEYSRLFPGVREGLEQLRELGIRTALATNKPAALTERLLEGLRIDEFFEIRRSSDSPGCAMKPRPDTLLTVLDAAGLEPVDALYVGDDPVDAAASSAAGVPCLLVTWGYATGDLAACGAAGLYDDPEALFAELAR